MREIKFRAWQGGRFHYWGFIKSKYGDDYEFHSLTDTNAEPLSMTEKMERSQQYTGLIDKNNIEIYEGDIVIFDNRTIGGELVRGEVVWCDDNTLSRLEWGLRLHGERQGYYPTDFLGYLEVIGNIYENPELLNKGEDNLVNV
ncbi:hypothetical protein LCGC14_2764690 [marine sediment metagenome]|uniref:YopX protein domain-containing protein n=1 Tax=marine sediment metagenome TaxID=412755 RepID=A0A0F8YXY4_9ZZZZ